MNKLYLAILIAGACLGSFAVLHNGELLDDLIEAGVTGVESAHDRQSDHRYVPSREEVVDTARKAFQRLKLHQRPTRQRSVMRSLQRDGEFFFNEVQGKKSGVNAFLVQHAIRQGPTVTLAVNRA